MLKVALSIDRDDADVHLNIGWLYHRLGKDSQAIEETQRAIALDPYNALAHHNLSVIYFGMGKYDEAVKYCDEALKLGRDVDHQYLEKLKPYRKSKEPFSPKAWRKEFFSHVVFTDEQRQRVLNRLDRETAELRQSAVNADNQGDYVLGAQYLERALLRTQAGTPEYYYILEGTILYYFVVADSYYDKGLYDTAIDYMNKAIMIMGTAPADFNIFRAQCYVELVDFYAKKGDTARMREYIQKIHPLYPEAAYALAREYALEDIFKK
jgi:tetratricopeptide (TPR) repeat protein